jgi:hypothetical protein
MENEFHEVAGIRNHMYKKDLQLSRFWVIAGTPCAPHFRVLDRKY